MTPRRWRADVDLRDCNTLRLPSTAQWHLRADDAREVAAALAECRRRQLSLQVLGEGSNVVLASELPGLTLQLGDRSIEVIEDSGRSLRLRAGGGLGWHELVHWCAQRGLWGVENLAFIPGTVGAAPVQNIGAYGQEFANSCHRLEVVERRSGRVLQLTAGDCDFGYRDSRFRRDPEGFVVTAVELALQRHGRPQLDYPGVLHSLQMQLGERSPTQARPLDLVRAITALRQRKLPDPALLPNAGSFFKNPLLSRQHHAALCAEHGDLPAVAVVGGMKVSAAWLIERCGWRGHRRGPVGVAAAHALVLVHHGGGDADSLLNLAAAIRTSVRDRFGIDLEQEPVNFGPHPSMPLSSHQQAENGS